MKKSDVVHGLLDEFQKICATVEETAAAHRNAKSKQRLLKATINSLQNQSVRSVDDEILKLLTIDGAGFAPRHVSDWLTENGLETSNIAVSNHLRRMERNGLVVRRKSRWFLAKTELPAPKPKLPAPKMPQPKPAGD